MVGAVPPWSVDRQANILQNLVVSWVVADVAELLIKLDIGDGGLSDLYRFVEPGESFVILAAVRAGPCTGVGCLFTMVGLELS